MKPCNQYQESIACLALDVLDSASARALQCHLETCPACRRHFEEMSGLTKKLDALRVMSEVQASTAFHQQLMRRLEIETPATLWKSLVAQLRSILFNWRLALPVAGAGAAVLAMVFLSPHPVALAPSPMPPGAVAVGASDDLAPTVANYQRLASRSFEEFNAVLTRQGQQNLPSAPLYTAGTGLSAL